MPVVHTPSVPLGDSITKVGKGRRGLEKLRIPILPACTCLTRGLGFYILQIESSGKIVFEQRILQLKFLKMTALKEQAI